MSDISFLEGLPPLNGNDALSVQLWEAQLKTLLENVTLRVIASDVNSIVVAQASEPSQVQWTTAWTSAGYTLPIPPTAILIWKNTSSNVIGGMYGTTPLSSTVVRRESPYPRTGQSYYGEATLTAAVASSTSAIGVGNTNHPALTNFTLPVVSDLLLEYSLWVVLSAGTGTWGADFLLDGVKVGTAYNSLPSNVGLINQSATGRLTIRARIPNVAAGLHTVQAIFGVTGSPASPPSLSYGGIGAGAGQYGIRQLIVRGVTV